MITVLQIVFAWGSGGVERLICNYIENMSGVKIDVLILQKYDEDSIFNETVTKNGGYIYHLENVSGWILSRLKQRYAKIKEFCSEHKYDIIHVNGGTGIDCLYAYAAKKGCPSAKVIMQSHADNVEPPHLFFKHVLHRVGKCLFSNKPDANLACSNNSLKWMFKEKYITDKPSYVLFNGIKINNFSYDITERQNAREDLGLTKEYVVGTVGRFVPQKNPYFILETIKELTILDKNIAFIWVGDGPLFDKIKLTAQEKHLDSYIHFVGATKNTRKFYLAMDCFILPSVYEGLGIVNIEAQAIGLPCVVSNKVPIEAKVTDLIEFIPLEISARDWAKRIISKKSIVRVDNTKVVRSMGYDRYDTAQKLYCIYQDLLEGESCEKIQYNNSSI